MTETKKLEIYADTKYYPAAVALEVTLCCNMRCLHCGSAANGLPRKEELSLEQWKDVIDQLIDLGTEFFTISGGEPFVWPHWRELAKYITEKGGMLSIITNAYNITDADITFLKDIGITNIAISIDGLQAAHDKIRGIKGAFAKATDVIKKCKQAGVKVAVSTSLNKINFQDLEPLSLYLESLQVDLWQPQVINAFGRAGESRETFLIDLEQYGKLIEFINYCQQQYKNKKLKLRVMPADSVGYCYGIAADIWGDLEWYGCNAGRYVIGIQSNGNIVGCLSLQGDEFVTGNIKKQKIAAVWNDDKAFAYNREFKPEYLTGACKGCEKGEACRAGCRGMATSLTGELYNNPYCYKHYLDKCK